MDVFVKVYKIENGNIAGGETIDEIPLLEVSEFGEVKKYLEEDATEFRMDSISLKTEFLPKGYFDDYTPQKPYLVEVQVGGWDESGSRCVFYGPIKKKSIKYDERTEVHSFTASSWERSIKQAGGMVARDRVPVKVAKPWQRGSFEGVEGSDYLHVVGKDQNLESIIEPGSLVNTSGKVGDASIDFRFMVTSEPETAGTVDGEQAYKFRVTTGAEDLVEYGPIQGIDFRWVHTSSYSRLDEEYYDEWICQFDQIGVPAGEVPDIAESAVGARVEIQIAGKKIQRRITDTFTGAKLDGTESQVQALDTSAGGGESNLDNVNRGEYMWFVLDRELKGEGVGQIDNIYRYRRPAFDLDSNETDPLPGTLSGEYPLFKRMKVDAGEDATVYSSDPYGQQGNSTGSLDPVKLAEGIATRTPALADLLDASPVVKGTPGLLTRLYEFSDKGIKALSEIQRSSGGQIQFAARSSDGQGGERKNGGARRVKLVIKTREHLAEQSAISLPDTVEWKGDALGKKPEAVLVKGPSPSNIAIERDEAHGWYPPGELASADSPNAEGKEIVEIEMPLVQPTIQGDDAFGVPENIPTLKGRAKRYFDFYSQYYKEKEVVLDAVFDTVPGGDYQESLLGQLVSEDDSVLESGIVKSQQVDYQKEQTTLQLWVADNYTIPVNADPVAILNAPNFLSENGSESVEVLLDATASYDPNGDPLSFTWKKNGTVISGATSRFYEATVFDGDTIEVVVEDPDGATDSDANSFTIIPEDEPSDPDDQPLISIERDPSLSGVEKDGFAISAWKPGANLEIFYRVDDGTQDLDNGSLGTSKGSVEGTVQVTRPNGLVDGTPVLNVTAWAKDTTNGVVSGETSKLVRADRVPEITNSYLSPWDVGGENVLLEVNLEDGVTGFDVEWNVYDENENRLSTWSGELLGEEPSDGKTTVQIGQVYVDLDHRGEVIIKPYYDDGSQKSYGVNYRYDLSGTEDTTSGSRQFVIVGQADVEVVSPNSSINVNSEANEDRVKYKIETPQKIGPDDDPGFNTIGFGNATAGTDGSGVAELKNDDGSYAPLRVSRLITEDGGGIVEDLKSVANGVVQARASIGSLDAVTARKSRKIESGPNVQQVGTLEDANVSLVPKPTFDQVTLKNQADETDEAVRADRSFNTGGNVNNIGDLTEDRTVSLVNQPTFKQVTLNEQANATNEAVRADRTVEVEGTNNQISVNVVQTTQGDLTGDVSVTLQTPQNIHEGADFRVDQLRVGTDNSPGTTGGAHIKAIIQHPEWDKGLEHWGMTPSGELDARLIEVDELIAKAFTADITQSLAGSDVLTLSAADLASDFSVPNPSDGHVSGALHIENVGEAGAAAAFRDGDTVRLRIVDRSGGGLKVLDVWGIVKNYSDQGDGTQKWDFETAFGTNSSAYGSTINKGSRVLDYGVDGDTIIQRTVLGSLSPYDRAVQWHDNDNDGVPDSYDILTQTGNIAGVGDVDSGLSKPGYYGSVARFTNDVVVGNLDAARSGSDGTYIKFTESNGIEIVVGSGNVETQINTNASAISNNESSIAQNEDDLRLIAQRLTQEQEARAGMSLNVGENSAEIAIQTEILSSNGITANTNITSRVETVETDTGTNTTAINSLESIVGDGQNLAKADLTLTAKQNTTDIGTNSTAISSLESIVGKGNNLAKANLTLTAVENTEDINSNSTAISSLESIVGDGQNLAKADLTLTAEQNTSDIGTNSSAISSLGSQVGSGSIDAASNLTLAANQNTQGVNSNASAISTLESQVGTGDITAASSLTLAANKNTADLELLAKYVTQESEARAGLETTVNENSATLLAEVTFEPAETEKDNNRAAMALVADEDGSTAALIGESIELSGGTTVAGSFTVDDGSAGGWRINQKSIRSKQAGGGGVLLSSQLGLQRFYSFGASLRATNDVSNPSTSAFVELFSASDTEYGIYAKDENDNAVFGLGSNPAGSKRSEDFFIDGSIVIDDSITAQEIDAETITANEIETDTIRAEEINLNSFWAKNATVENTLTFGTDGKLRHTNGKFIIDKNGHSMAAAGNPSTADPQKKINWFEGGIQGGTEIAYITADEGSLRGSVHGDENYSVSGISLEARRASGASDYAGIGIEIQPTGNSGESKIDFSTPVDEDDALVRMTTNLGGADRAVDFMPKEQVMIFGARLDDPTSQQVNNWLDSGEALLYLVHEGSGSSSNDVRLQYYEKKGDGTLAGPKKVID